MRGWIMGGHATCRLQLGANDSLQLAERAVEVVVDDLVLELRLEGQLALGDVEALLDLPLALGRARPEPPLQLLAARSGNEDGHRGGDAVADPECAPGLDLEERRAVLGGDPVELGPERAGAVALSPGQLDPFEKVAGLEPPVEL